MEPIDMLLQLLKGQQPEGPKTGNWQQLTHRVITKDAGTHIEIKSMEVGFAFDTKGNFKGMYNWKG